MAQDWNADRIIQEQARALREALAEAYARHDLAAALKYSRKLDALQVSLWQAFSLAS